MNWTDVAAAPAAGKSTLCYPIWSDKSVGWDGKPTPRHWAEFLYEATSLMRLVQDHKHPVTGQLTIGAVVRMNTRSAKKMSTVYRMQDEGVFIQTGWCQRILGFGWRLVDMGQDVRLIGTALRLMPVSVGVAFLEASPETLKERNRARRLVPETSHEDRSFMIDPMMPAIAFAKEVLRERGVAVREIDVERQPIEAARRQLLNFAYKAAHHTEAFRSSGEVAPVPASVVGQ
jgi:hypothetical protein